MRALKGSLLSGTAGIRTSASMAIVVCLFSLMLAPVSGQTVDIPKTTGVWMQLTIDGNKVDGESADISLGRQGSIECMGFNHEVIGQGGHNEIRIIKRIDKASPMLHKAQDEVSMVTATIMVFQKNDSGPEFHRFTIEVTGGMIHGIRGWMPNKLDESVMDWGFLEEVSIRYDSLTITDEIEGGSHTYDL